MLNVFFLEKSVRFRADFSLPLQKYGKIENKSDFRLH